MKHFKLFSYTLIGLFLISCQNELDNTSNFVDNYDTVDEKGIYSFIYNDIMYSSSYHLLEEEENMIIEDKKVAKVIDLLNRHPNVATFIHEDGVIEYFDNEESMQKAISDLPKTRAVADPHLWVYQHINYGGEFFNLYVNSTYKQISISTLKQTNKPYDGPTQVIPKFNDKISSFSLSGSATVTFYRDTDFRNESITFSGYIWVPNLKDYPLSPGSKKNWNDRISSLKLRLN